MAMTEKQLIDYLIADICDLLPQMQALDINDNFGDYLAGVIDRSQTVLRMMGVDESLIPSDGSC
jgi:hypothetical protein